MKPDFEKIFKSKVYVKIISFFYENQASIDTPRGVATWTGCNRDAVKKALEELAEMGVLIAHPASSTTGYSYTRDDKIIKAIDKKLKELKNRGVLS